MKPRLSSHTEPRKQHSFFFFASHSQNTYNFYYSSWMDSKVSILQKHKLLIPGLKKRRIKRRMNFRIGQRLLSVFTQRNHKSQISVPFSEAQQLRDLSAILEGFIHIPVFSNSSWEVRTWSCISQRSPKHQVIEHPAMNFSLLPPF